MMILQHAPPNTEFEIRNVDVSFLSKRKLKKKGIKKGKKGIKTAQIGESVRIEIGELENWISSEYTDKIYVKPL